MKALYTILVALFAVTLTACPSDDPKDEWGMNPNTPKLPDSNLDERDGIASANTMDRLLYFVSAHEDGPGLYAYRPAESKTDTIYIDPDLDLSTAPFIHMIPRGVLNADSSVTNYRAGGVMYAIASPVELTEEITQNHHQYTYVSSDPSTQGERYQISKTTVMPGLVNNALFSYDLTDLTGTSFLQAGSQPLRFDLSMGPDDEALEAPEGKVLMSYIDDELQSHTQWLFIDEDDALVFYDEDFTEKSPVIDVGTGDPITNVARNTSFVSHISYNEILVGIAIKDEDSSDFQDAFAYRVVPPDADNPQGRATRIENADGDPLIFKASLFGGLMTPSEKLLFVRDNTLIFGSGDGLNSMLGGAPNEDGSPNIEGVALTRIEGDEWSYLSVKDEELDGFDFGGINLGAMGSLPDMLIPVEGHGVFWAPLGVPELIEPNSNDPEQWTRTSLADVLPEPEDTPITESVNGWIYYNHTATSRGGAVAYHVPTQKLIHLAGAKWIGASGDGTGVGADSVSRLQASEIFVQTKDNLLAAVEADAPEKGFVPLGTLPADTEEVSISGRGLGPHRLIGLEREDDRFEVIAVDTTQRDSLVHLMETPAEDWEMEMGEMFGEVMTTTIQAAHTAPVRLY